MKRIHLFEFEDQPWLPNWLRKCTTRLINVMHQLLGTKHDVAALTVKAMNHVHKPAIVDLCSGSGGPMLQVPKTIHERYNIDHLSLTLTDLYPDLQVAQNVNNTANNKVHYRTEPVDVRMMGSQLKGVRTMIGSFHHFNPEAARQILKDAQEQQQPICVYEISDNNLPTSLWWISIPSIFIMSFFITPFARPMSWQQLVFTYLIPIIPICFAWDGAASNARTYTLDDMEELLEGLESNGYHWERGRITRKAKKLYLMGMPVRKSN